MDEINLIAVKRRVGYGGYLQDKSTVFVQPTLLAAVVMHPAYSDR